MPDSSKGKNVFIDFDGVYRKSEVWINGHSLGMRPSGYISFRYDLAPYLKYGAEKNIMLVKVDNSRTTKLALVFRIRHLPECLAGYDGQNICGSLGQLYYNTGNS